MTHRDYMLGLLAQLKLGERAGAVLGLCARPVAAVKVAEPGAVVLARLNEEERRLRGLYRRKWGIAVERLHPSLRSWQGSDGRDH